MRGDKSSVNLIGQLFVEVHSQKQIGLIFTERIPTFKESSAEGRVSMELLLSIIFLERRSTVSLIPWCMCAPEGECV